MSGLRPRVFNVGAEWFVPFLEEQRIEVYRMEWSPPVENPADIAALLQRLGAR
jgi:hypothetical protein